MHKNRIENTHLVKHVSNIGRRRRRRDPFIYGEMKFLGYGNLFLCVAEHPHFTLTFKYLYISKKEQIIFWQGKERQNLPSSKIELEMNLTFLFRGLALNLGIFSSSSFSSSTELLIFGGRALSDVWRWGDFGAVRWCGFHSWLFCYKKIDNTHFSAQIITPLGSEWLIIYSLSNLFPLPEKILLK